MLKKKGKDGEDQTNISLPLFHSTWIYSVVEKELKCIWVDKPDHFYGKLIYEIWLHNQAVTKWNSGRHRSTL